MPLADTTLIMSKSSHVFPLSLFAALLMCIAMGCSNNTSPTQAVVTVAPTSESSSPPIATAINPSTANTAPASIYNESIPKTPAKRILIAEVELMRDALRLLAAKNWDGNLDNPLPLSQSDFDAARLSEYSADAEADNIQMTMSADIELLYLSTESAQEIRTVLLQARSEYLAYARTQQVSQKYLDEFERVLPPDSQRLVYHPTRSSEVPPSAVEGVANATDGSQDYSRYQLDVYAIDLYNIATDLEPSHILGDAPASDESKTQRQKQWRDMAARKLIYHEMTHVLQRAFINLHVSDANYRTSKDAFLWASDSLARLSQSEHWLWGNDSTIVGGNNQHLSNESQADGVAFEILAATYNLSQAQRDAVWDHLFGRLENARKALDEIKTLCESRFPTLAPDAFGSPLARTFSDYSLKKLAFRLVNLSAYVGYVHPLRAEQVGAFWDALRMN